ncbi:MAG: gfo/Idh/MocA family oxidoreductase, partial [Pirellula sp.]
RSVSVCHLANIVRELQRPLRWDPDKELFVDDPEADKLLLRERRKGFELP